MGKRVLVAKKRGRLAGALLGSVLAGPVGAAVGAALNSKTDYFEGDLEELAREREEQARKKAEELDRARAQLRSINWRRIFKYIAGFFGFCFLLQALHGLVKFLTWIL